MTPPAARIVRPDWRHRRAADRARRYRQRHRADRVVVTVEIDQADTAFLVDCELLQLAQVEDRQAIGVAIRNLIDLVIGRDA